MIESFKLRSAREHLARAEATFRTADGLYHLEQGLALLDDVIAAEVSGDCEIARNVASAYALRICECVRRIVQADRALPEPDLEHLFKLLLAFDQCSVELPDHARSTKIDLVQLLMERYHEGYPPEEKRKAKERLAGILGGNEAGGAQARRRKKKSKQTRRSP